MTEPSEAVFIHALDQLALFKTSFEQAQSPTRTKGWLQGRQIGLKDIWLNITSAFENFCTSENAAAPLNLTIFTARYSNAEITYYELLGALLDELDQSTPSFSKIPPKEVPTNGLNFKLPTLNIPTFSGDYDCWRSFKDIFTSVIYNNPKLTLTEKFYYLVGNLTGRPKELVNKFPLEASSFETAWKVLENEYENKRVLVNTQLKILFSLQPIKCENATSIRNLKDTVKHCVDSLNNLQVSTRDWDPILVFLVLKNLPESAHSHWENRVEGEFDACTWAEMDKFLSSRIRILEAMEERNPSNIPKSLEYKKKEFCKPEPTIRSFYSTPYRRCVKCNSHDHTIYSCQEFANMETSQRQEFIRLHHRCFNCFGPHHIQRCTSVKTCQICLKRHHTLLHMNRSGTTESQSDSNERAAEEIQSTSETPTPLNSINLISATTNHVTNLTASEQGDNINTHNVSHKTTHHRRVLLATALTEIKCNSGSTTLRCLIDQGSESSFIIESVVQSLKLNTIPCSAMISGVGSSANVKSNKIASVELFSLTQPNQSIQLQAFVLKKITNSLPSCEIPATDLPLFENISLADPEFQKPREIHILLGADLYAQLIRPKLVTFDSLVAQESIFGYIISGCVKAKTLNTENKSRTTQLLSFCNQVTLNESIQRFWELEEIYTKPPLSLNDSLCEKHFQDTHYRRKDGRFVVELPFIKEFPSQVHLGLSRSIALKRFESLERKLKSQESQKQLYHSVLQEYITLGHMMPLSSTEQSIHQTSFFPIATSYYLPHHGVFKADSMTSKLRVVFDASCKTSNGISLNDVLYSGPSLQSNILDLLTRNRLCLFVYSCDIKMMYRQIWLNEKHTDYQRILFRAHSGLLQDYKLLTVTFGVSSSPYLAMRCLQQLAQTEQSTFPVASNIILHSSYVDDIFAGFYDISTAHSSQIELVSLLKSAGFELHKWSANNPTLLKTIPPHLWASPHSLEEGDNSLLKSLGILFDNKNDAYLFRPQKPQISYPLTKRRVFAEIAKLYDPGGWLAPLIINSKVLMQDIWKDGTPWDESILPHRESHWKSLADDISNLTHLSIPRWFQYNPSCQVQLHGFCDASIKAYAACIYIRVIKSQNKSHSTLISAKTRVAPVKTISVPRLELCGALLLSKLIKATKEGLNLTNIEIFAWTDSTIVLSWLNSPSYNWKTFVANRVSQINENCGSTVWRHINGEINPADLASRGLSASELVDNNLWFYGPPFLKHYEDQWPSLVNIETTEMDIKTQTFHIMDSTTLDTMLQHYSCFFKACRIFAYIYRFLRTIDYSSVVIGTHPTQPELELVKSQIIKVIQMEYFPQEYQCLRTNQLISKKSRLISLNPYLDDNGVMRVNGRLSNLTVPIPEKFPIIIPTNSRLSYLIIKECHDSTLHGNVQLMQAVLRKAYWIPKLKQKVRKFIHNCKRCFLERKELLSQIMAPLPIERLRSHQLFSTVGLDFGGPITLWLHEGRCRKMTKGYICLFVCFSTKAIHLEAVSDLTSKKFLDAFERFISRRGLCHTIYSDNGTNFVEANNILKKHYLQAIKNATLEAANLYAHRKVNFVFNCPLAPHMAGLAEAGIKSVKYHLRRTLGTNTLTFENMNTVLCRIEACLNSRPLTAQSDDPEDLEPLTPGHFIRGNALLSPPEPQLETSENSHVFRVLDNLDKLKVHFWRRWKDEYLHRLQQRSKWQRPQRNLQINDLVVLKDSSSSPQCWSMGRVVKLYPGVDGNIRVVEVFTSKGVFKRSVTELSALPYDRDVSSNELIF